jgi:Immunoglobulin-like domain of bacterial spore germination/Sporulation and spore germination
MNPDRDLESILRSAMRDETDRIEPTNHLQDILRRTARPRDARRRGWVIGLAGAGLVAASVTTAVWIADPTGGHSPQGPVAIVRSPVNVPVYYVQANGAGKYPLRIYPEQHRVTSTGEIGFDAVSALFTTPPTDPDYSSLWASGSVEAVTKLPGLITVDLSADAAVIGGRESDVDVAMQQIVYTVQQALHSRDPVRILISGSPPSGTAEPLQADPAHAIEGAIVINSPVQDATVQSPVTVEGDASVFEGTVSWQVLESGQVVKQGYTTASAGQVLSPYLFEVDLDPGSYTLRVYEASAENGSPMFVETKQFTVE